MDKMGKVDELIMGDILFYIGLGILGIFILFALVLLFDEISGSSVKKISLTEFFDKANQDNITSGEEFELSGTIKQIGQVSIEHTKANFILFSNKVPVPLFNKENIFVPFIDLIDQRSSQ